MFKPVIFMKFFALNESWIDYCDMVGDRNLVHRDEEFARRIRFGPKNEGRLEGIIAPGMWIVSHLGQNGFSHAEVTFKNVVYDRTRLQVNYNKTRDFSILSPKGVVVDGKLL